MYSRETLQMILKWSKPRDKFLIFPFIPVSLQCPVQVSDFTFLISGHVTKTGGPQDSFYDSWKPVFCYHKFGKQAFLIFVFPFSADFLQSHTNKNSSHAWSVLLFNYKVCLEMKFKNDKVCFYTLKVLFRYVAYRLWSPNSFSSFPIWVNVAHLYFI